MGNEMNCGLGDLTYTQAIHIIDNKVKDSCVNPEKTKLGWKKDKPPIFGYQLDRRSDSPECMENKNWYNNMQVMINDNNNCK